MHRPPTRSLGPLGVLLRARGAVVAVVALVSVAAVLLAAVLSAAVDPDGPARLADATPATEALAQAETPPAPTEVTPLTPVVTYDVFLARDPFEPVVPEPEPDPPSASPGDSPDPSDPSSPTGPSSPTDPSAPSNPSDPTCTGGNEVVCNGQVVTLLEVVSGDGEQVAVIQVDTSVYEVRVGEVFATHFELRTIDGQCIGVLYGDDGFQLCAGDTVLK